MIRRDVTADAALAGRIRQQAQKLLNTLQNDFGDEGLSALDQCKYRPADATLRQQAIAHHIRAELGPQVFWLGEALALWHHSRKDPLHHDP